MDHTSHCHRQVTKALKGLFYLLIVLLVPHQLSAQLNPINNLYWEHWYIQPYNYFDLSWEQPDSTLDTLVGYNVYRETELYRFQTETSLYHTPAASNCGEDFVVYNGGESFWMHVTAVYNSTLQESDYIDSAYCNGYAIGVFEHISQDFKTYPNPFTTSTTIEHELTEPSHVQLTIYNAIGETIHVADKGRLLPGRHTYVWSPEKLSEGLYYAVLRSEEGVSVIKIIKQ